MKRILVLLISVITVFSCETEDSQEAENYNGPTVTYFVDGSSSTFFVRNDESVATLRIGSTALSSSDRTFTVSIDPASTAVENVEFTLPSTSVTIPANEYFGEFQVNGIFDGATEEGSELILNLSSASENVMVGQGSIYTLEIFKLCESHLEGMYSVTTTYGYHDFLPNYNPATIEMEVVALGDGVYSVYDFSGGLYSEGPYASAYGTGGVDNSLIFSDVCGNIQWTGQTDPWGDLIPLDGGVNSVDPDTGVITISWYCTGYGEEGVSVYTPL